MLSCADEYRPAASDLRVCNYVINTFVNVCQCYYVIGMSIYTKRYVEGRRVKQTRAGRADRYLLQHAKRIVGGRFAVAIARRTTRPVAIPLALAVMQLHLSARFRQILQLLRSVRQTSKIREILSEIC